MLPVSTRYKKKFIDKFFDFIMATIFVVLFVVTGILVALMYQDPTADVVVPMKNVYMDTIIKLNVGVLILGVVHYVFRAVRVGIDQKRKQSQSD